MAEFRHQGPTGGAHPADQARKTGPVGKHGGKSAGGTPGSVGKHDAAAKVIKPTPQKSIVCACNRDITLDELMSMLPNASESACTTFLPFINASTKTHGMTTCIRKAHFLAQVGPETGDLKWMKELGANHGGYEGRGLLQLTHEDSYEDYGDAVQHDFLGEHAKEVEEPKWAVDSGAWIWEKYKKLNAWADKNDLRYISARINGGFIGYDDRRARLPIALDWLLVHTCKTANIGDQIYIDFDKSGIYDNLLYSFAWGIWNDPAGHKQGIARPDPADRKAGYTRFLALQAEDDKKTIAKLRQEAAAKAAKAAKAAAKAHHGKPAAPATPAADAPPVPDPQIPDGEAKYYGLKRKAAIAKAQEGIQ
jgi:putative chitinase